MFHVYEVHIGLVSLLFEAVGSIVVVCLQSRSDVLLENGRFAVLGYNQLWIKKQK